ncbi:hypothetical protein ABEG18_11830 [Alsobacter sp. KACC 23698]|uniref:Sel1 repeat family protein n=1 Tax=Alsobacter sp. KACC 23698 TaxID=3149229 RepID=A0AAU7JN83_9HYPH
MLDTDLRDPDAPLGAGEVKPAPLRRQAGATGVRALTPFLAAGGLAVIAAGLATLTVSVLTPADRAPAPSDPIPSTSPSRPVAQAPVAERAPEPAPRVVDVRPSSPSGASQEPVAAKPEPTAPAAPAPDMRAAIEPAPAPVPAPAPAPAPVPAASPTAGPAAAPAVGAIETGSLHLSGEEVLSDLERGEGKLQAGDIAAARRYFERVALAGDARGAIGMARSYDPDVLAKLPVVGLEPDASVAAAWYDKAKTLRAGP